MVESCHSSSYVALSFSQCGQEKKAWLGMTFVLQIPGFCISPLWPLAVNAGCSGLTDSVMSDPRIGCGDLKLVLPSLPQVLSSTS